MGIFFIYSRKLFIHPIFHLKENPRPFLSTPLVTPSHSVDSSREREHASVRSLKDRIHMLEKFHRFDVFPSAILVGEPFPILSAIVKIEHARHGV